MPRGKSKWSANFQVKGQRSRSSDVKKTGNWRHVYLWAADQAQGDPSPTAN